MPQTVLVAAIQGSSVFGDTEANKKKFSDLCREASANGAKIIVLPEASLTGYLSEDMKKSWHVPGRRLNKSQVTGQTFEAVDPCDYAECVPGPLTKAFCALAQELHVYITIPFVEKAEIDGATCYFNTVCLASPDGELVAHYRKNNPWPYVDHAWITAGNRTAVVDTPYGRVGLAICFDVHVMFERYERENLWALLYSVAWVDTDTKSWFTRHLPIRVAKVEYNVVAANWSLSSASVAESWQCRGTDGYGHSSIYDGSGSRLAGASSLVGDEIIYANLETKHAAETSPFNAQVSCAQRSLDLTGLWRSNFYGPTEDLEILLTSDGLKAKKKTGDLNVPAGMVSWWTKGVPRENEPVQAWFQHRDDVSDPNGFYWELSELQTVSNAELHLTLKEGGRLRGSTGIFKRVRVTV